MNLVEFELMNTCPPRNRSSPVKNSPVIAVKIVITGLKAVTKTGPFFLSIVPST